MFALSTEDRVAFMAALKNGMGFTTACRLILVHPKVMSAYVKANPELERECTDAMKYACKALLIISNEHLTNREFDRWRKNNSYIREFVSELVMWESLCRRSRVTPGTITRGYHAYKNLDELATSVGMDRMELLAYIAQNSVTAQFFADIL